MIYITKKVILRQKCIFSRVAFETLAIYFLYTLISGTLAPLISIIGIYLHPIYEIIVMRVANAICLIFTQIFLFLIIKNKAVKEKRKFIWRNYKLFIMVILALTALSNLFMLFVDLVHCYSTSYLIQFYVLKLCDPVLCVMELLCFIAIIHYNIVEENKTP